MAYFVWNNKVYKEGTAVVGPSNRGFRYGDGVFETMKMKSGKLILEDAHFARLWKGMDTLAFEIPRHFTPEGLSETISSLARKNGHEKAARIRLQVVRGNGGLYDPENHAPNYIIETWALPGTDATLNSNGLELGIYKAAKKNCDILCNLKHNNYLPYVMAALHAKKEKWNDALVLNNYERICDSTIANIFIVKNEEVITPALSEGCVAGVMREHLISILKTTSWKVKETAVTIEDVVAAEEVFLSNSIQDIRWVKSIDGVVYKNETVQKIYSLLLPTIE